MGNGLEHAALAVFTTLAPVGAMAFVLLAVALFSGKVPEERLKRLDACTALPVALVIGGFVAALLHPANSLGALGVFAGVGTSPLSNEVLVGCVFTAVMLVYWVLALAGRLNLSLRRALCAVLAVLAVAFSLFCGLAYLIPTVPTWNTPWTVVEVLGYALLGGTVVAALVLALARVELAGSLGTTALALAALGLVVGAVGFGGFIASCGSIVNAWGPTLQLVPAIWPLFAVFALCGIVGLVMLALAGRRPPVAAASLTTGLVVVVVGVFVARIAFYGMFAGLTL